MVIRSMEARRTTHHRVYMLPADLDLGVRAGGGGSRVWFKREGREIVLEREGRERHK
jgi:hypothetical protein